MPAINHQQRQRRAKWHPQECVGEAAVMLKSKDRTFEFKHDIDVRNLGRDDQDWRCQPAVAVQPGAADAGARKQMSERIQRESFEFYLMILVSSSVLRPHSL